MKPLVEDKGIIAKLGDRILTTQELRRLPKGVKDRVVFYPEGATPDDELDENLKACLNWGFITPILDGNNLTAQQYDSLPSYSKNKVRFNITDKGGKVLGMDDYKKKVFLHFDRWVTKKEVAEMMGRPLKKIDEYVSELVNDGLMEEANGKFKSKESMKFLRVKDYLKHFDRDNKPNMGLIKGVTEWATREEVAEQLGISLKEINESLDKQIAKGFIEEKDGKFRINDSDGKGKERITNYLDELNKSLDNENVSLDKAISSMVMGGIYEAIKKGWIEFMDGKNYTADEWQALNYIEKERIGIRLTEKGRLEIEDGNPLKLYDELGKKKRENGGLNLVKNVVEKDGGIILELTEEGNQVKKMGEAMGISPEQIFKTMMNVGLNREISKFMILEEKGIVGNRRIKPKTI